METEDTQTIETKEAIKGNNCAKSIPAHPIVLWHKTAFPKWFMARPMKNAGSIIARAVIIKSVTPTVL